ncbi:pectinesterase family protein [Asticcacaulis sp. AND118]|uniref:pectinesterase family protein n=1 Tax=Asticcacaulis sp. AND118 TaxID=2840468 RepID=UPI001CFFD7CD|nr:pectinesterase family protein [Asticcacaulis sp. AND118]UDF05554.1 pectinesterase family protein [Asticcacaulis sp. AND118]
MVDSIQLNRRVFCGAGALALISTAPALAQTRPVVRVPADHKTLAAAFAALPDTGGTVEIAPGTYREKLTLSKPDVHLVGKGKKPEDVIIVWGDSARMAGGTGKSSSFTVNGDGFRVSNLTIQNDYHLNQPDTPSQAVALSINADRAVLTKVRLLGAQDTLYAASKKPTVPSRQYYRDCYIEGHVDFIFGNALAFFDHCHLHIIERDGAFITAHSRTAATETTAYVFDHCRITTAGSGTYYLGRAWRPYAQVVFLDTRIDGKIHPEGWREWTPGKTETYATAHYAEYNSSGSGGDMSQRVFWAKKLTADQAAKWRLEAVFPDRSWIS